MSDRTRKSQTVYSYNGRKSQKPRRNLGQIDRKSQQKHTKIKKQQSRRNCKTWRKKISNNWKDHLVSTREEYQSWWVKLAHHIADQNVWFLGGQSFWIVYISGIIFHWNVYHRFVYVELHFQHAFSCPKGGFMSIRHNEVRDFTAELRSECCNNLNRACITATYRWNSATANNSIKWSSCRCCKGK